MRALGVKRLALFGSVSRNEARPDSDVDLLVQFLPGTKSYDKFEVLCELLEQRLGRRVEPITTEALSVLGSANFSRGARCPSSRMITSAIFCWRPTT